LCNAGTQLNAVRNFRHHSSRTTDTAYGHFVSRLRRRKGMDQAWITHTLSARRQNRQYSATFQQRQGHAVTSVATIQHEAQAAPIIDNDQRHDHHPLVQSQEYGFIEPCHEGAGELVDLNNANRAPKQLDSQIELHDNWKYGNRRRDQPTCIGRVRANHKPMY
jgi:hypothetical protein